MADETNTGGGASIGGNASTGGGSLAARDHTTYNNNISNRDGNRDAIDDMRTDIILLKDDVGELKFGRFEMRNEIASLRLVQQQLPERHPLPALVEEQRRTNDLLRVLIGLLSALILGVVLLLIIGRL